MTRSRRTTPDLPVVTLATLREHLRPIAHLGRKPVPEWTEDERERWQEFSRQATSGFTRKGPTQAD